jgi:hypothetical protein
MNEKRLQEYYRRNYEKHGVSERSLGWTKGKQFIRFHQLTRHFRLHNSTIIDVGCGFADFVQFALNNGIHFKTYHGVDLMQEFLNIARNRYSGEDFVFTQGNYLDLTGLSSDYVIGSGLFGHRLFEDEEDNYNYIRSVFRKSLIEAKEAISFDFLSDKVQFRTSEQDFHASPNRVVSIGYELTNALVLDNSAMPFEFSITLFKNDQFSKDKTVFDRFLQNWSSK